MANIRTHYDNLKVARNAPASVIKAAYKALCQTYHPDKFQGSNKEAERIMKIVNASYVELIDPVNRAKHDVWICEQEAKESEKAQYGKTDQQHYQRQYKPDTPKTEQPRSSTKANQQSHSSATEAEIKQKWEQWRNNGQRRFQKQQSWSPNGYWETNTPKRTIQEFVIILFFTVGLVFGLGILLLDIIVGKKEGALAPHQVQTQPVQTQQAIPSSTKKSRSMGIDYDLIAGNKPVGIDYNLIAGVKRVATATIQQPIPVFNQPEQPLPQSGANNANFRDGVAPLKIRTSSAGGHHYFVKIVNLLNSQPIGAYFIHSGETIDIKVPLGTYEIRYASGTKWYGLDYLFGSDTTYNKADSTFDFSFDGYQYSGYTIELIMQQNGNLSTSGIKPNQW